MVEALSESRLSLISNILRILKSTERPSHLIDSLLLTVLIHTKEALIAIGADPKAATAREAAALSQGKMDPKLIMRKYRIG